MDQDSTSLNEQIGFEVKFNPSVLYPMGGILGILNIFCFYIGFKNSSLVNMLPILLPVNLLMGLLFIVIPFSFDFKKVRIENNKIFIFYPYRLFKKTRVVNLNQVFHIDIYPARGKGGSYTQLFEFYFQEDGYQTGKTKIGLSTYKADIIRLTQYFRAKGIRVESDYE